MCVTPVSVIFQPGDFMNLAVILKLSVFMILPLVMLLLRHLLCMPSVILSLTIVLHTETVKVIFFCYFQNMIEPRWPLQALYVWSLFTNKLQAWGPVSPCWGLSSMLGSSIRNDWKHKSWRAFHRRRNKQDLLAEVVPAHEGDHCELCLGIKYRVPRLKQMWTWSTSG